MRHLKNKCFFFYFILLHSSMLYSKSVPLVEKLRNTTILKKRKFLNGSNTIFNKNLDFAQSRITNLTKLKIVNQIQNINLKYAPFNYTPIRPYPTYHFLFLVQDKILSNMHVLSKSCMYETTNKWTQHCLHHPIMMLQTHIYGYGKTEKKYTNNHESESYSSSIVTHTTIITL